MGSKLKVLLWFQGWPSYLAHATALTLKKQYGINDFSGLVLGRRLCDYLKKQREIKYDPLVLVQDIFLKSQKLKIDYKYLSFLEKKYGIPMLWMYPIADRDFLIYNRYASYTHEEFMKIIQGYFKYTIKLLKKVEPDFVIMPPAESMELLVLHEVAHRMNIPTLLIFQTRVKDKLTMFKNTYEGFDKIFEIYDKLQKGKHRSPYKKDAEKYIEEFRKKAMVYSDFTRMYVTQQEFLGSVFKSPAKTLKRALGYFYHYYFGYFKNDYMYKGKSPLKLALVELEAWVRRASLKKSDIFENPNYNEKYTCYFLHFEPETALVLLAPFYIDQAALIENIAKSLPVEFKLYVKEHPMMVGFRPMSYYQRLLRMPNVRLIKPSIPSYELIKNSRLVFTVTGTPGLEGVLLKKPVITFGRVFYNKLDMVRKATSMTSLPELVRDLLENYKHDEKQLVNFMTAIFEGSFDAKYNLVGSLDSLEETLSHPDFKVIVDAYAEEMGLKSA